MSKKSINTQGLVLLLSLSCVAFAGPKKKFVRAQSEETVKQAQGQSTSSKKRASSVSRKKESSRQESINLNREEVIAQQPAPSIQQTMSDQVQGEGVAPALEQVVQEQGIVPVLQNAGEIKEQAVERHQFFNSRSTFPLMTSFLGPKAFVNFAYTSKKICDQLLGMPTFFDSARARFAQDGCSSFFDLEKIIRKERLVEFLSSPDKKPLLRKCLKDGKLCIALDDIIIRFLNQNLPNWKQALADLQAPIVVFEEMGFNLLTDPRLSSQIIAGELFFGFGCDEGFIERNALLPLIQQNNLLLRVNMALVNKREEFTKSVEALFKTKQVVSANLSAALLMEPSLDLSSIKHLYLSVGDLPQFYALAENLVTKAPNLEYLSISRDREDPGILDTKAAPALPLKWEKLKSLDIDSWKFQSYDEFKDFYRAMPRGLTTIRLSGQRFNFKQLSEFGESLKTQLQPSQK